MLVTTWLHYRRKRQMQEEMFLSLEGGEGAFLLSSGEISGGGQEPLDAGDAIRANGTTSSPMTGAMTNGMTDPMAMEPEEKENIYKGILWMKEKYEQYRDMADRRYEQLKEELARAEKKYQLLLESGVRPAQVDTGVASVGSGPIAAVDSKVEQASYPDLLEEKNRQIAFLQQQLDQRIKNFHQAEIDSRQNKSRALELEELQLRSSHLLEEKQAYIDQLEGQLVAERQKIEELVTKLQASSQQLLTIYEELDRSLKPTSDEPTGV